MFKLVTALPDADFLAWGWRVPFWFSAVMLVVGLAIRLGVNESPDFLAERRRRLGEVKAAQAPLREVVLGAPRLLVLAICANVLGIAGFYFTNTFMIAYATTYLKISRALVLDCLLAVSVMQFLITPLSAYIAERVGVHRFLVATAAVSVLTPYAMFTLVDSGTLTGMILGVGLAVAGLGAFYAVIAGYVSDSFPTRIRYTGISMAYQLSGAIFGGLTPILGTILAEKAGGAWWPLALLFSLIAAISLVSVLALRRLRERPLQRAA
ncbi:MFS transporter [Methylobacterium radiodurans]|uniref:MFS transporter n=1 Tax=Methylobacterium radiodurans TaxID=2202828 RepID=UPI001FEC2274|nr:MFS transporter [Methylobacterium radiodurans]